MPDDSTDPKDECVLEKLSFFGHGKQEQNFYNSTVLFFLNLFINKYLQNNNLQETAFYYVCQSEKAFVATKKHREMWSFRHMNDYYTMFSSSEK